MDRWTWLNRIYGRGGWFELAAGRTRTSKRGTKELKTKNMKQLLLTSALLAGLAASALAQSFLLQNTDNIYYIGITPTSTTNGLLYIDPVFR